MGLSLFLALVITGLVYTRLLGNPSPGTVVYINLVMSLPRTFPVLPVFLLVSALGFSLAGGSLSMVLAPLSLPCAQGVREGTSLACSCRGHLSSIRQSVAHRKPQVEMRGPLPFNLTSSEPLRPKEIALDFAPPVFGRGRQMWGHLPRRVWIYLA